MNIVLVDDDALVCASLKTILEAGGEVRVAATGGSGAEAVALYRAHRPDEAGFREHSARAAGGARGTERVRRRGDGTASGADAERGRLRLRGPGSEREGAGRHRAGSQGVQQQGDRRRAVPQRGDGAQLSQRDPRQARTAGSHPAGGVLLPPPGRVRA